jgi:CRP-like cAMP-binding protein
VLSPQSVYFVEHGIVSLVNICEDGRTIEAASLGREGLSNAVALLGGPESEQQYIVQVAGRGLQLSLGVMREYLRDDAELAQLVYAFCGGFLAQALQGVGCNGLHTVQERCCTWLLLADDRLNGAAISVTHDALAHILGVRRASISTVLAPMQISGLLRYGRGHLEILDRAGVEREACDCYALVRRLVQGKDTSEAPAAMSMV